MSTSDWDFKEENTKIITHGFHTYPAMMIPQVAQKLIKEYSSKKTKLLFDPYCGTGTSLVEATVSGINSIGTDLNPLARIIAEAKTTIIEQQTLEFYLKDFNDYLYYFRYGINKKASVILPNFSNVDFWFSKQVKGDLAVIKNYIDKIEDESIRKFFIVAFSQTIRECSWTRKNEFKLYKMDSEKIKHFKPNAFLAFENALARNRLGLIELIKAKKKNAIATVHDFNTVNSIPTFLSEKSVDLIVTSPPYGDSPTTVAYGQFSRLANEWLGFENCAKIDRQLMGGYKKEIEKFNWSATLNREIAKIQKIDENRAKDVCSFYSDYKKSISNVSTLIAKGGYACYVVSNRCVRGVTLSTDIITKDFFEESGLTHIETFTRKISSKRMPRKNSPTGSVGVTSSLMNKEYIVVMQKK